MAHAKQFINLDQYTVQKRETLIDSPLQQVIKLTFDQGLIIITTMDKTDRTVKFHSNYGWKKAGDEWQPDLTQPNEHYREPSAETLAGKHFKPSNEV